MWLNRFEMKTFSRTLTTTNLIEKNAIKKNAMPIA